MPEVVPFRPDQLEQLAALVNVHVGAVVPGWAVPAGFLARRLERDPGQYVVDPWVAERVTLVATERDRLVAAAHLLRYEDADRVGDAYRGAGEIAWLVAWPSATAAAGRLLARCSERLDAWGTRRRWAAGGGPYVPAVAGVPDAWPHVAAVLRNGGFRSDPGGRAERLYAGWLPDPTEPAETPLAGLAVERRVTDMATRFAASLDGEEVAWFDVATDATSGGELPALAGWADAWNLEVRADLRSRGIGTWLVRSAVGWLRLAGCDRILVPVDAGDEAAGAGRFHRRLGWHPIATLARNWSSE